MKRIFGKLFIHNYDGNDGRMIYIISLLGILWGFLSVSLNFDFPINLAKVRTDHYLLVSWSMLPAKITAYLIGFSFDMFRFVFEKTPVRVNDMFVMAMFVIFSPLFGSRILTFLAKLFRR